MRSTPEPLKTIVKVSVSETLTCFLLILTERKPVRNAANKGLGTQVIKRATIQHRASLKFKHLTISHITFTNRVLCY